MAALIQVAVIARNVRNNMKSLREQIKGECEHFIGVRDNKKCKAGMVYDEVMQVGKLGVLGCMLRLPCHGDKTKQTLPCEKYSPLSEAKIDQIVKEFERRDELLLKGLSFCCEAPIDESQVIKEGRHKGHGGRFCSKCKKVVFWV